MTMSLKLALKALESLGLTGVDAEVYVYLAKKGPHEEKDLANALKLARTQLRLSIESLLTKGMIITYSAHSVKYSAIELEKVLEQFLETKKEQAKILRTTKKELLSTWRSSIKKHSSDS
jgi:sugar-specific transcriptional regulator TrmB